MEFDVFQGNLSIALKNLRDQQDLPVSIVSHVYKSHTRKFKTLKLLLQVNLCLA